MLPTPVLAAHELGASLAGVQRMIRRHDLYAYVDDGHVLVPTWQLLREAGEPDAHPLPHLARVLPALPPCLHPFAVRAFFLREVVGVDAAGRPLVVRDWLAQGGAPEAVLAVAAACFGPGAALRPRV